MFYYVKGSIESILKISSCSYSDKKRIHSIANKMSKSGERVIGIAKRTLSKNEIKDNLSDYIVDVIGIVRVNKSSSRKYR